MRIISGKRRGAMLAVPQGSIVRPTAERVREGLFNILIGGRYGKPMKARVVADVFAGTGGLGLEAWSRGAGQIVFIENNSLALPILEMNIKKLGLSLGIEEDATIIRRDATRNFTWPAPPAELVFLDPPWVYADADRDFAHDALLNLIEIGAIADGGLISIEHDHRRPTTLPQGVAALETRKWGKSACTIARYAL